MADDIIEIDDYEVKDKQIIETDNEEDYQRDSIKGNMADMIIKEALMDFINPFHLATLHF